MPDNPTTQQPDLLDAVLRIPFYGRAETNGCGLWWFTVDGKRRLLTPEHPILETTDNGR